MRNMLHGFSLKSRRLAKGTRRNEADAGSVESVVSRTKNKDEAANKNKGGAEDPAAVVEQQNDGDTPKAAELLIGIIDGDDDGVEIELCDTTNKNDHESDEEATDARSVLSNTTTMIAAAVAAPGPLYSSSLLKTTEVGDEERQIENSAEESKAREKEAAENHDKVSVKSLKEEEGRAQSSSVRDGTSGSITEANDVHEEERDDTPKDRLAVVYEQEDSTADGTHSVSGSITKVGSFYTEGGTTTRGGTTSAGDQVTTGSTFWADDGTSPIDFLHAIATGEVWSDLFDDGKTSSSSGRRAGGDDDLNPIVESLSDFIQGDENKRAYFASQRELETKKSRREQAKQLNAARSRATKVSVPSTKKNGDTNPSKQSTKVTLVGSKSKSGVVAFMKNHSGRRSSRELITTPKDKESHHVKTALSGDDDDPRNPATYMSAKTPWLSKAASVTSSKSRNTQGEESRGWGKNKKKNDDATALDDELKDCLGMDFGCGDEISQMLLSILQGDTHDGRNNESHSIERQLSSSSSRQQRTMRRSPSPRTKSRGSAVLGTRRPSSSHHTRVSSPPRHRSPSRRALSQSAAVRRSSPSPERRRKALPPSSPRGRSSSRASPTQRSKTMSPTSGRASRNTSSSSSKIQMMGSRSKRGLSASPRSSSVFNPHSGRTIITMKNAGGASSSAASRNSSSTKHRIGFRSIETKRKTHQQYPRGRDSSSYHRRRPY